MGAGTCSYKINDSITLDVKGVRGFNKNPSLNTLDFPHFLTALNRVLQFGSRKLVMGDGQI